VKTRNWIKRSHAIVLQFVLMFVSPTLSRGRNDLLSATCFHNRREKMETKEKVFVQQMTHNCLSLSRNKNDTFVRLKVAWIIIANDVARVSDLIRMGWMLCHVT